MRYSILSVREHPELLNQAIEYFSGCWPVDQKVYQDAITNSITTTSPLPRWYLMMDKEKIIGSYSLITNDFCSRQDLWPYLATVYIDESYRGRQLGSQLLLHGRKEAKRLGFNSVYLLTDHIGFYEKYGWQHIGTTYGLTGDPSRLYQIDTI